MDWIWHVLLGVEEAEQQQQQQQQQQRDAGSYKTTSRPRPAPPLHPAQKFRKLCEKIAQNDASLKELWLWDVSTIRKDCRTLIQALSRNTQLTRVHVELGHENSSSSQSSDIVHGLCRKGLGCCLSSSLQHLSFSGTFLNGEQLCSLAVCLESLSALSSLDLSNCKINDIAMHAWSQYLLPANSTKCTKEGAAKLVELNLEHNALSSGSILASVVNHSCCGEESSCYCSLKILKIARNQFRDESIIALILSLSDKVLCALQDLDLAYNRIEATGPTLRSVLASFPSLCRLCFDGNTSGTSTGLHWDDDDDGGGGGGVVMIPETLKSLSLRSCHLHDSDTSAIARAFRASNNNNIPATRDRHSTATTTTTTAARVILNQLDISNNHITDIGIVALLLNNDNDNNYAPFLLTRRLNASRNAVRCGRNLLARLRDSSSAHPSTIIDLKKLDLSHNHLHHSELKEVEFWIQLNATGARHLLSLDDEPGVVPFLMLFSMVVGRAAGQADLLFYILSRKPDLLQVCREER